MRSRQRIVRALIANIIADVNDKAQHVILTIHWRGGQHSQLRVKTDRGRGSDARIVILPLHGIGGCFQEQTGQCPDGRFSFRRAQTPKLWRIERNAQLTGLASRPRYVWQQLHRYSPR